MTGGSLRIGVSGFTGRLPLAGLAFCLVAFTAGQASSLAIGDCESGDAPSDYVAECASVCEIIINDDIDCTIPSVSSQSAPSLLWAVRSYTADHDYSVWGQDGGGTAFCCTIDATGDSPDNLNLYGSDLGDEIYLTHPLSGTQLSSHFTSAMTGTVYGEGGDDYIIGSDEWFLYERLYGGQGSDRIFGGDGHDDLDGGGDGITDTGTNRLHGGDGDDDLYGGEAVDRLFGDTGEDTIRGRAGDDGEDTIFGGPMTDYIEGGEDNDTIYGGVGIDYVYGDGGIDDIFGGDDGDFLYGGDDDDTIYGQAGDDYIEGGVGDDTIGGDYLACDSSIDGDDILHGGTDDDTISGCYGDDELYGNGGRDVLYGNGGTDLLEGGYGNDELYDNQSSDVFDGGNNYDFCAHHYAASVTSCETGQVGGFPFTP